jgi:tRNA (guanine-N7-)-methyltransferase
MKIDFDKYPYPRKIRHHTSSNLYFPIKDLKIVPSYYPPLYDDIDISKYFGNSKSPDILDIGCGKSKFLLAYSEQFPDRNILGIELRKGLVDWAQNYILNEGIKNAWVIWYSAVNGLKFIQDNSIAEVFYLFPDPWPKLKQQNRRLFSIEFLNELYRIMEHSGKLYISTDCDYVDEYHLKILKKSGLFDYEISSNKEWKYPRTNKEEFCRKNNIPIYRIEAIPKK